MKRQLLAALSILLLAALACSGPADTWTPPPYATPAMSIFDSGRTAYGFFPSPPEATTESVIQIYTDISQHGDVVLLQQPVPWEDFAAGVEVESQSILDTRNQYYLANQNGLEVVYVVDPLNGLDRREFAVLPESWEASFANPQVRAAYGNYALRIVREFHPRYIGLASEINTYMDVHPGDALNFLSLYAEVYDRIKAESPETQVFVTFQWEELNNLMPSVAQKEPFEINWEQVEAFEPRLDAWVISSYPFVAFGSAAEIPAGYYAPLLERTDKPLAVAEGGYTTQPVGFGTGSEADQVAYLEAIHNQIGGRLVFWIYLILSDFDLDSYRPIMVAQGQGEDINTLGMFAHVGLTEFDGTPKPALEVWDSYRSP